jgi:hypothetical protein
MSLPTDSLVSFWRSQYDSSPGCFVCSGVFVGDGLILTVKHAFEDASNATLWARPHSNATQAMPLRQSPHTDPMLKHPELDAALVRVEAMPLHACAAPIDFGGNMNALGPDVTLNGYFRGHHERPLPLRVMQFDASLRHHETEPKHPEGYSGAGVANGGKLWGISYAHYTDGNVARGCVLSIDQLMSGWLESHLRAREAPSYDIPAREEEIRQLVGQADVEGARKRLMDLIDSFLHEPGMKEAKSRVTSLSARQRLLNLQIDALRDVKDKLEATMRFTMEIVDALLVLLNEVVESLSRRLQPGAA